MTASPLVVWVVTYLVNSAWQLPVLLLCALFAARAAARLGPGAVYRVWAGALALAVLLPALRIAPWHFAWLAHAGADADGTVRVTVLPGSIGAAGGLRLAQGLLLVLFAAYGCSVLYHLARLVYGLRAVRRLRREAVALPAESVADWAVLQARMGGTPVRLASSTAAAGPMVLGGRPALLLLPQGFLEHARREDAMAALAHELAHVCRYDYERSLACQVLLAPLAYHPCAWLLRARLGESREMACDAMAAAALDGNRPYARALLRLAAAIPAALRGTTLPAVGVFDGNTLERRVTTMMHTHKQLNRGARAAIVSALLLFAAAAGASVSGLHLNIHASSLAAGATPKLIHVSSGVMAGNILSRVNPTYPAKAKAEHVEGTCTLELLVNKAGAPTQIHLVKSVRKDIDENSVIAVRQWRWKPYLLNGNPIAVDTTVNITYSLGK